MNQLITSCDEENTSLRISSALFNPQQVKKLPQFLVALIATLGGFAAGTVFSWTTSISLQIENNAYDFPVNGQQLGFINASMTIGAAFSSLIIILIQNILSAKNITLLFTIPFFLGWILIIYCQTIMQLYAGRFLTGLSSGVFCVTIPIYLTEIAHKNYRGFLTSLLQLTITFGISYACILGAVLEDPLMLSIACAPIPLIFGLLFLFVPESPVHLFRIGEYDKATHSLKFLRGPTYNPLEEMIEIEALINDEVFLYDNNESSLCSCIFWKSFFNNSVTRRSLYIIFGLIIFQQMSGINPILVYMSLFFKEIKTTISLQYLEISFGIIQCVSTLIALFAVDRLGRKFLLTISALFMAMACSLIMLYFSYPNTFGSIPILPILSIYLYIIMYSVGLGPILWTIPAEILPPEVKSTGMSIANLICWFLATVTVEFFDWFHNQFHWNSVFALFGIFCSFAVVFICFFVPETKNKSLKDIQEELAAK